MRDFSAVQTGHGEVVKGLANDPTPMIHSNRVTKRVHPEASIGSDSNFVEVPLLKLSAKEFTSQKRIIPDKGMTSPEMKLSAAKDLT